MEIMETLDSQRTRGWISPLVHLSNNWASLAGVVTVTSATVFWLFLLPITLRGEAQNPYIGILTYLALPGIFFLGLLMIPLGIAWRHRRELSKGQYPSSFPPLTMRNVELRRLVTFIGVTTFANLVIGSQLTYAAVTYMEKVSFCGQTCHVMEPEFTAFQHSPHSRVECVNCHIGAGASWFVRSKISGAGQVVAVALNNYPRPIPTPVHNLRPARETCETCHWPQKYAEDRLRVFPKFAEDEVNTLTKTVMMLKVGGGNHGVGIHGTHLGQGVRIRYASSDEGRQTIPWVEYSDNNTGRKTTYLTPGVKPDAAGLPIREMDCMDCHNRPAHSYQLPDRAVDNAMSDGAISAALPFAKKTSLALLKRTYVSRAQAAVQIPSAFEKYYKETYAAVYSQRGAEIARSAQGVLAIYNRNIFPDMNVTWGIYPVNVGHTDFPGCFRCHDEQHVSSDKKTISQDCNSCHNVLAVDEPSPKILTDLGMELSKATPP
jgi:nitrate/TMAO reductase-like tetraheme cytochrome c subunit